MGRFLLGFAIGATVGVAVVVLSAPRPGGKAQGVRDLLTDALDVGRRAASHKEQELWSQYRTRITEAQRHEPVPPPWTPYAS
jgi:gas vesicle protein